MVTSPRWSLPSWSATPLSPAAGWRRSSEQSAPATLHMNDVAMPQEPASAMALARLLMEHRDIAAVRRRLAAWDHSLAPQLLTLLDQQEPAARAILRILDHPLDRAAGGSVAAEL